MGQVGIDRYKWSMTGGADDVECHTDSNPMESLLGKRSGIMKTQFSSSSQESSIYSLDERSTPSSESSEEDRERRHSIDESNPNFLTLTLDHSFARRKTSTCSDTSSIGSTSVSIDGGSDTERNSPTDYDTVTGGSIKYDDIIDKIVELRFSKNVVNNEASDSNEGNVVRNDVNGNYDSGRKTDDNEYWDDERTQDNDDRSADYDEEEDDDDDDLVERGPVRPPGSHQSRHSKPYNTLDWLAGTSENPPQDQSNTSMYESTAQEILRNKNFSEKMNPCLDKLSDYGQTDRSYYNIAEQTAHDNFSSSNGWASPEANYTSNGTPNSNVSGEEVINASIPSIVLFDPTETALLENLVGGGFQAAQSLSDSASVQNHSPGTTSSENWPDSPASSSNVLSSRSQSRASSRAQSPGSSANVCSPLLHINIGGRPAEFHPNAQNFRVGQALSSSESSNHSYGNTPSPTYYQHGLDPRVEEQLDQDFQSFSTWYQSCPSSGTVVNSEETIDSELQLVEEVISGDQRNNMEGLQAVPKAQSFTGRYETCQVRVSENDRNPTSVRRNCGQMRNIENVFDERLNGSQEVCKAIEERTCPRKDNNQFYADYDISQLGNTGMLISSAHNNLVCPDLSDLYSLTYSDGMQSNICNESPSKFTGSLMDFENPVEKFFASYYPATATDVHNSTSVDSTLAGPPADPVPQSMQLNDFAENNGTHDRFAETWREQGRDTANSTFDDFRIPETVSSYIQNRPRRTSERNIAPWPSLNLPQTAASERLKAGLDPKEVERAMMNLLKKPTSELAAADEDGDTMLMCLVGNPSELEKKRAYLAPLVERLGSLSGALTMMNNRNEDALYLAAMNCPQMAYITGYLAAAMLQRGIDVSQRFYNTKGDTLVHAIAAKGDSHGAVLAELLSLRTVQGNAVFDLSKRNYDGRTPLHVAVESHGQPVSGGSSIGTIRLLLENGADPKVKETKSGNTALHMAVSLCSDSALVKALLNNNGREAVNTPNYDNNTPVHMAAALTRIVPVERHRDICAHLIQAGGLTNIQNRHGKTPLALVCPERKDIIRRIFHKKA